MRLRLQRNARRLFVVSRTGVRFRVLRPTDAPCAARRSLRDGANVIADELCPECHGPPELVAVKLDRLVKRCRACGIVGTRSERPTSNPTVTFRERSRARVSAAVAYPLSR